MSGHERIVVPVLEDVLGADVEAVALPELAGALLSARLASQRPPAAAPLLGQRAVAVGGHQPLSARPRVAIRANDRPLLAVPGDAHIVAYHPRARQAVLLRKNLKRRLPHSNNHST